MSVGAEPLLTTIRDEIRDLVEAIDHDAEGYWYNYGPVSVGTLAEFRESDDPVRPIPHLRYTGPLAPRDALGGNEIGYRRFVNAETFELSFVVIEVDGTEDHDRRAYRIASDMHAKLLDPTNRRLGHTASNQIGAPLLTWRNLLWYPDAWGAASIGGLLVIQLGVRYQHQTGDMSAQG